MNTQATSIVTDTSAPSTAGESGAAPRAVDWNNPRVAAILEAAGKCFSRRGFSATTLAEIGKELGLRKSIVHYYFASKAALIHEVQSFTYNKYLDRVKVALGNTPGAGPLVAVRAMWDARTTGDVGLDIEVWSASRNDAELRRRAASLQKEKRKLVVEGVAQVLANNGAQKLGGIEPLCTLILGVINGLSVSDYIEGDEAKADEAYAIFLQLLRAGLNSTQS